VNIIVPPLCPRSPAITIRRFRAERFSLDDLVAIGSMPREVGAFLAAAVRARANILISGGTGSGKTTLLGALASHIPADERVITIENPIELRLRREHVLQLEARPPGIEGRGEVTQRDLLRNALRMRPDLSPLSGRAGAGRRGPTAADGELPLRPRRSDPFARSLAQAGIPLSPLRFRLLCAALSLPLAGLLLLLGLPAYLSLLVLPPPSWAAAPSSTSWPAVPSLAWRWPW
jgi:hypothetical protein